MIIVRSGEDEGGGGGGGGDGEEEEEENHSNKQTGKMGNFHMTTSGGHQARCASAVKLAHFLLLLSLWSTSQSINMPREDFSLLHHYNS